MMDFRVTETAAAVCEILADTFQEQPVDGDFVLPEYCPDVAAVLKCTVTPAVQSRQLTGDRLLTDGTVGIRVMYLDEDRRTVRCCEFSQPFSGAFSLGAVPPDAHIRLTARVDYVNCRAISPRRLDVHGAFTLHLLVTAAAEQSALSAIEGEGVYTRRCRVTGSVPAAFAEKPFTLNETLEPGEGRHPALWMIRSTVTPVLTECRLLMNKAIVKGKLLVKALYALDEAGTTERAAGEIPFSQILDLAGAEESWICDADLSLLSAEVRMEATQAGETPLLAVTAKVLASVWGWRAVETELVCDAYSSFCPLTLEVGEIGSTGLTAVLREERTLRQTCELPSDTVREIPDLWCEVSTAAMTGEGETLSLEGRILWCMLVTEQNGEISYYERAENYSLPFEDGRRDDAPEVQVLSVSFQNAGEGKVELKADLAVTRRCRSDVTRRVLTAAAPDESAAYPPDKAALKICYARRGESLWDIARRCRTSVEAVTEENRLTGDTLAADTMLLIPLS